MLSRALKISVILSELVSESGSVASSSPKRRLLRCYSKISNQSRFLCSHVPLCNSYVLRPATARRGAALRGDATFPALHSALIAALETF